VTDHDARRRPRNELRLPRRRQRSGGRGPERGADAVAGQCTEPFSPEEAVVAGDLWASLHHFS